MWVFFFFCECAFYVHSSECNCCVIVQRQKFPLRPLAIWSGVTWSCQLRFEMSDGVFEFTDFRFEAVIRVVVASFHVGSHHTSCYCKGHMKNMVTRYIATRLVRVLVSSPVITSFNVCPSVNASQPHALSCTFDTKPWYDVSGDIQYGNGSSAERGNIWAEFTTTNCV